MLRLLSSIFLRAQYPTRIKRGVTMMKKTYTTPRIDIEKFDVAESILTDSSLYGKIRANDSGEGFRVTLKKPR